MNHDVSPSRAGCLWLPAKHCLTMVAFVCALGVGVTSALATTREWTGVNSAFWSDPGNWSPSGIPQNDDSLDFDQDTPHLATENDLTNLSVYELYFNNNYNYQVSGNSIKINNDILSASGGSVTITINCPMIFADGAYVMSLPGGTFGSENKGYMQLNGSITIPSGQMMLIGCSVTGAETMSGHLSIVGPLVGAGDITAQAWHESATASVEFDNLASNTNFTGRLWLDSENGAPIIFNQASGVTVASTVGVRNGTNAILQLDNSDQSGTTLDIESGAQLSVSTSGTTDPNPNLNPIMTFNGVVLRNYANDPSASTLNTGNNWLYVNGGGITASCDSDSHTPTINGWLNCSGFVNFNVYGAATVGLNIPATIGGNGFKKIGTSTLILTGTNIFSGVAEVDGGTLDVRNSSALGSTAGPTVLGNGALTLGASVSGETLDVDGQSVGGDLPGATLIASSGNAVTWSGPVVLNTNLDVFGTDITFTGTISGVGGMGLLNFGTVQIGGSSLNSFTGPLLVRCSLLEIGKSYAIPAYSGPLIVGGGFAGPYEVRWLNELQSSGPNSALTVYANGLVNLNSFNEQFGTVTFNGGTIETGTGLCMINQSVAVNSSSSTAMMEGFVSFPNSGTVEFDVADGSAEPDLLVTASISGSPTYFTKDGPGSLALDAANTYNATTLLKWGTLEIEDPAALGNTAHDCEVSSGATLALIAPGTVANNIAVSGTGVGGTNGAIHVVSGSATLSGSIQLGGATTLNVESAGALGISGIISGTGPLTKAGAGAFTLSGPNPNTFSGDLIDGSGLLYLSKTGATPIAVPGNLVLGPAPSDTNANAILLSPNSIGGAVTVNVNSVLNLNGRNQTLSQLTLNDGGNVQTGSGTLILASGATVNAGSLGGRGFHGTSSIQGNIGLTPNGSSVQFNVSSYPIFGFGNPSELDVPAVISVNGTENQNLALAGITKSGSGRMRLGATNTFMGGTIVNNGALQVDGSLPDGSYVSVNGGILTGTGRVYRLSMLGASAVLAPGNGPGTFSCGSVDALGSGFSGTLNVELNGTGVGQYDQLVCTGLVNLSAINLTGSLGYAPSTNDQFTIISNTGMFGVTSGFNGLAEGAAIAIGDQVFRITYHGGDGNDVVLTDIGNLVVPELTIQPAETNSVRLVWPTNVVNFTLESTTNLPATNWTAVAGAPVVVGTNEVVTNSVDSEERFYRLAGQ